MSNKQNDIVMQDVYERAHDLTVEECKRLGYDVTPTNDYEGTEGKYTDKARKIFDKHYHELINKYY